jgi:quinol monooxygenase YgiN
MALRRFLNRRGQPMIMRVFQVTTHPGKEGEFGKFFHETAIPLMKQTPGLASVFPGAPRPESPSEFCMIMIWEDLDSLRAFVGEDYMSAHIHPEEAELVLARTIKHYDFVPATISKQPDI